MNSDQTTVIVYDCGRERHVTGRLLRTYPKGITIEDKRGIVHYATFDRVITQEQRSIWLW